MSLPIQGGGIPQFSFPSSPYSGGYNGNLGGNYTVSSGFDAFGMTQILGQLMQAMSALQGNWGGLLGGAPQGNPYQGNPYQGGAQAGAGGAYGGGGGYQPVAPRPPVNIAIAAQVTPPPAPKGGGGGGYA